MIQLSFLLIPGAAEKLNKWQWQFVCDWLLILRQKSHQGFVLSCWLLRVKKIKRISSGSALRDRTWMHYTLCEGWLWNIAIVTWRPMTRCDKQHCRRSGVPSRGAAGRMKIHLTYMLHVVFAILNLSHYKVLRFFFFFFFFLTTAFGKTRPCFI